jgi:hypothetical protein
MSTTVMTVLSMMARSSHMELGAASTLLVMGSSSWSAITFA